MEMVDRRVDVRVGENPSLALGPPSNPIGDIGISELTSHNPMGTRQKFEAIGSLKTRDARHDPSNDLLYGGSVFTATEIIELLPGNVSR
ncbi:hypothetical protein J2S43_005277 [Catenuloplanes nepalensis]|uniref:Uncharacterized protein n=1 Tax=Catenuloplanes nepalensis TaxID=587533 RepID=A0ABT9MZA3_9ACTN|nr:hypothetical protein [Catenuloplanes nepalensis]MDP9796765.1 hypothetical protein [Catenuloplanes nepalensis]